MAQLSFYDLFCFLSFCLIAAFVIERLLTVFGDFLDNRRRKKDETRREAQRQKEQ